MKKTIAMMIVLTAACGSFGGTYEAGRTYGPITILGNEPVTVEGNGAIIDGGGTNRCATLGPNVTLRNFTFTNGKAAVGGGVWGGRLENCTIRDCTATEYGAAAAKCALKATDIVGCRRPLDGAVTAAMHGGVAADSTLEDVTITGCRVELGTTVPGFGGLAANSALTGCSVSNNTLAITGDHYGLLFYGGLLVDSTIQRNSVDSSVTNMVAYMKVAPSGCTLDGGEPPDPPDPPPGPTPPDPPDPPSPLDPPPPPVYPETPSADGEACFGESAITVAEGSNAVIHVCGGNTGLVSTVQLQAVFSTAAAADLNLKKVKVDGIVQSSFKFPFTLTMPAGERTEHVIEIPVVTDKLSEADEFFTLKLGSPKNVRITGEGACVVTIRGTKAPSAQQRFARAAANDVTRGTVSGSKICKAGTAVTFKATATAGNAFLEWRTNDVQVTTAASWSFKMPDCDVEATAVFVPVAEDYLLFGTVVLPAELKAKRSVTLTLPVPVSLSCTTVKVTGLPSGLSYDAKKRAIVGAPKSASSKAVTVTVTVTNRSGYKIVRKYQLKVVKGEPKAGVAKLVSETKPANAVAVFVNNELVGKATGAGVYAAGAKVTLKATAAAGSVFTGWGTNGVAGVSRKPSWAFTMPVGAVMATAEFRPVAEDYLYLDYDFLPAELKLGVAMDEVIVPEPDSLSQPTVTVSGLPNGLKYKSGKITGKPTKTGKSTVTVTASNLSGYKIVRKYRVTVVKGTPREGCANLLSEAKPYYALTATSADILAGKTSGTGIWQEGKKVTVTATARTGYVFSEWCEDNVRKSQKAAYAFTMPARDMTLEARFVTKAVDATSVGATVGPLGFGAKGSDMTRIETNVYRGVRLSWKVVASAASLPSVKVSGLPKGLSYKSGKITGVPTVASASGKPSTVKIAVTTAGGTKKTYSVVLTVKNREAWARATYTGKYVSGGVTNGTMTLTVATDGKVSGKIVRKVSGKTKTTSLSASSVTSRLVTPPEDGDVVMYLVEPAYKSGKTTVKIPFYLQEDPEKPGKGVAAGESGTDLWQK